MQTVLYHLLLLMCALFVYSLIIKCYIMWYFACGNGRVLRSCNCGLKIIVFIFQVIVLLVSVLVLLLMIFLNLMSHLMSSYCLLLKLAKILHLIM